MPLDIAAIVASTLISDLINRSVKAGHDRLGQAADEPLKMALSEACKGFAESVQASFGTESTLDARLQVMMADEPFLLRGHAQVW